MRGLMSGQRGSKLRKGMGLLLVLFMMFSLLPGGSGAVYASAENIPFSAGEGEASNAPPALKSGVPAEAAAEVDLGDTYTVNLDEVFEDPDGDPLTYTVKVDQGEPVAADAVYSYTPAAGNTVLVFTASDGDASSTDTYTVSLTCQMGSNAPPALKSGVPAEAAAEVDLGDTYTVNLDEVFEDPDGDPLTYTVKVDQGEPVAADAVYSYTPAAGNTVLVFTASDGMIESESHTVTITVAGKRLMAGLGSTITFKVAPSTNQVTFYATTGFDSNGYDLYDPSSPLLANDEGVTGGYRVYTVQVPDTVSTISFRGTDAAGNALGGMTVDLDDAVNGVITLRQAELYIFIETSPGVRVFPTADEAEFMVKDADYKTAAYGSTYILDGKTRFRYLLYAGGNAELYTYYAAPKGTLTENYATGVGLYKTIEPGTSFESAFIKLPLKYFYTITAPTAATVQVFDQIRNFCTEGIESSGSLNNGDGTTSHVYNLPEGNGNLTYRVSMNGHITKAGYFPSLSQSGDITVTWSGNDASADTRVNDVDSAILEERLEESVLLNVNSRNCLELDPSETYRLRAYRIWQIINSDTANIMIEPDFHYNVISGSDAVSINPVTSGSGNASGNWLDITAVNEGVAIIELTYDAIDIGAIGDGTLYTGVYAASDPHRTGLLVIQVGGSAADIDLGIGGWDEEGNWDREGIWDAECDTLYFNGASGELKLSPSVGTGSISNVEVLNNPAVNSTWTSLSAADGVYTATITPGNNILRVTAGDAAAYQIVRGATVTTVIENVTQPGQSGDTVKVSFEGLYMPMPKFSGIYNPGYGSKDGHFIAYSLASGLTLVSQEHVQYDFTRNHALTLAAAGDGSYPMIGGHIHFNVMGVPEPLGEHRVLSDAGIGANFSAYNTYHSRSILPDVIIGATYPSVSRGDLNGDGNVNSMDATILAKHLVGIALLTGDQLTAADLNGDGNVNSMDATILARYLVGLISEL